MKLLLLPLLFSSALLAENISFWQIQKVKSNDTLNVRAQATHKSTKVTAIPFNAQCVKNHGCGKDINLEAMMHMQENEVKTFLEQAKDGWCYVEYEGKKGWVNQVYVKASTASCK